MSSFNFLLPLTVSNLIGFGVSSLVTLFVSIRLIKNYLKSKEKTIGYFAGFITARLGMFLFFALTSLSYLLFKNLFPPAVFFFITWVMVFISLFFPPMLFCSFKWQKLEKIYPGMLAIVGIIGILGLILGFKAASLNPSTGIAFVSLPRLSLIFYILGKTFGVLPLAILFLSRVKNSGEKWLKMRSFFVGLGLLWVFSTVIVPSLLPGVWAGMYCCIGDILIFAGISYKKQML